MNKKTLFTCALSATLLVTGCGGGGGGGSAAVAPTNITPPPNITLADELVNGNQARTEFNSLGISVPAKDSSNDEVIQSTNPDMAELIYDIYGDEAGGHTNILTPSPYIEFTEPTGEVSGRDYIAFTIEDLPASGRLTIYIGGSLSNTRTYTLEDGKNYAYFFLTESNNTDPNIPDATSYTHGGVWLYAPDDGVNNDYGMGAHFDANRRFQNLGAQTGIATYSGEGVAIYSRIDGNNNPQIRYVDFRAALSANFNTDMVNGRVDQITGVDGFLTLSPAAIDTSVAGGFFTGELGSNSEINGTAFSGNWGGEFFQENNDTTAPAGIGGTVGGHGSCNIGACMGSDYHFVGTYITYDN